MKIFMKHIDCFHEQVRQLFFFFFFLARYTKALSLSTEAFQTNLKLETNNEFKAKSHMKSSKF